MLSTRSIRCPFVRSTAACLFTFVMLLPLMTGVQRAACGTSDSGNRIEGDFKFLPIPYVNYDRSIGLQGGFFPMVMFNPFAEDTISPSSMVSLFGLYTTNKTWVLGALGRTYLDEDNWRVTAAWVRGNYNFQFFVDIPVNDWIPYSTDMSIFFVQVQRRFYRKLYGGLSYVYQDFETTLGALPEDPFKTKLHGLGFSLALDYRSSVYYPRTGFETTLKYLTYPGAFGNETDSEKIEFEYNHYIPARRDFDVIAGRFFAGAGLGNLAFEQQFIVGQRADIRGYTQGEYRGNYMLALQGEYRWNFFQRLSAVGFVGVATVFDAVNENDNGKLLPGGGTGLRFAADTETNMNVGLDVAAGIRDWGIYFKLGEAF
jgi:hypothetical protein